MRFRAMIIQRGGAEKNIHETRRQERALAISRLQVELRRLDADTSLDMWEWRDRREAVVGELRELQKAE